MAATTTTTTACKESAAQFKQVYSWVEPPKTEVPLLVKDHFSSLLFGGSVFDTALEFGLLLTPIVALLYLGNAPLDVAGSMPFKELATFFCVASVWRRVYNAYLEAVWFTHPEHRTQPPKEHKLKTDPKDLCGRELEQLRILGWHDKMTMLSQFALNYALYFMLPGFYPSISAPGEEQPFFERFIRLVLNHYLMSFCMYWSHRALHVNKWLWEHVHSIHHWAKHPLSRNTYEDHWADNFGNAIVGHAFAQILVPLDNPTFWFSRLFRIMESLEKHSGVSCGYNLAHSCQRWLPFAQMPHHHDWHHEGHKGCNYTFSSLGGLWDCVFGTRKSGRCTANGGYAETREDRVKPKGLTMPRWFNPLWPVCGVGVLVALKLRSQTTA